MRSLIYHIVLNVVVFSFLSTEAKSQVNLGVTASLTAGGAAKHEKTRFKTLDYLYSISGKKTISGIHNREPNSTPARWTNEIYAKTGRYPGLWSGDFLFQAENIRDRQLMINEAKTQWRKGAIVNIMWHACNPALNEPCEWNDGEGVLSSMSDSQFNDLLTDGTTINRRWKKMMDDVSVYLQQLEDEGVEVLFRPLHEMNQGKFWWAGRPGQNGTAKLYRLTHDYMVNTKGLSNLIWVWDMQDFGSLTADLINYNPGNEYWDVAALDVYSGDGYTAAKYKSMLAIAGGKPIAIGECEKLPSQQQLIEQPKWTFFMGWSELTFLKNSESEINALYHSDNVITLDQMIGW
jgi:mannan endo-1,4-beta-mannosidase